VTAIAVVSAALALFHGHIAALVGDASIGVLLLVGIGYVSMKSISGVGAMFFQGFNRMDLHAAVSIVSNLVLIVAVPGLVLLGFGLTGAMAGYALSSGVAAAIGVYVIYTRFYTGIEVTRSVRKTVSCATASRSRSRWERACSTVGPTPSCSGSSAGRPQSPSTR
jgi:O-antigen/teichoic acid export membrane protein